MNAIPALVTDGFHRDFADTAELIVRERERTWPHQIKANKLDADGARHRLFVMRSIAAIWRHAADNITPHREAFLRVTRTEALDEIDKAIEAAERRLRKKPDDRTRQLQHEQLRAMRWWHAQYPSAKTYALNMLLMLRFDALQRAEKTAANLEAA